ncbi:MAG: methylenetetrahydrofolate reductase C-terminal domain-containing protein [Rhodospirillales bacterium]|nr:methylenetetrahydrofolate reductase C-terminal domain-containing protein [Rhodospirillales bacterium]
MYSLRLMASKNARLFEIAYNLVDPFLHALDPLWRKIGYDRAEKPFAVVEELAKGLFFDCQMCGRCTLNSTGMTCPMNCPKDIRNGPCGGVRADGNCEIKPDMRCVWMEAWRGSEKMKGGGKINNIMPPVDHTIKGTSAWLRVIREDNAAKEKASEDGSGI